MEPYNIPNEREIMDCSSLTISYQPNGLATIGYTLYKARGSAPPYQLNGGGRLDLQAGGNKFIGWITSVQPSPQFDVDADEYKISAFGIGCKQ